MSQREREGGGGANQDRRLTKSHVELTEGAPLRKQAPICRWANRRNEASNFCYANHALRKSRLRTKERDR